jgi:transposase-like protein
VNEDNPAVADLRSRWHTLCDLDRAREVQAVHQAGMSLRELAGQLDCSRTLLSRLLRALMAPPEDLARARQIPISTRELARRAGTSSARATTRHNEAIAFELERAAMQGSQTILSWLSEEGVAIADWKQIVELARVHLAHTGKAAGNEQEGILTRMLFDEVGRQSRPGQIETDRNHFILWSALRLALWILRRIPDRQGRARAFELALGDLSIP